VQLTNPPTGRARLSGERLVVSAAVEDTEVSRLFAIRLSCGLAGGKTQSKQLPHGRRAAGHAVFESEIVDCRQFLGREHDLETLTAREIVRSFASGHGCTPGNYLHQKYGTSKLTVNYSFSSFS
jgi:hypothetical protein